MAAVPEPNLGWNTYGVGIEAVGRDGAPEPIAVPAMAADQMLVRVDADGRVLAHLDKESMRSVCASRT